LEKGIESTELGENHNKVWIADGPVVSSVAIPVEATSLDVSRGAHEKEINAPEKGIIVGFNGMS
jgi:hypothetical protein